MGGLAKMPQLKGVVYFAMFWAWWAILGLPLGAGFFSKDLILERLFDVAGLGTIIGVIAVGTAGLTAVYMTRVMYLAFWSDSRVDHETKQHASKVPFTMQLPLVILGIGSIVSGILLWNELPGLPERMHSNLFERWLSPVLDHAQMAITAHHAHGPIDHHTLLWLVPVIGSMVAVAGWFIARARYGKGPTGKTVAEYPSSAPYGFGSAWTFAFDRVYDVVIVKPVKAIGLALYWIVELALVSGGTYVFSLVVSLTGGGVVGVQRSRLRSGLAMSFLGLAVILVVLLWNV